jgi:hypothetical protein
MISPKYAVGGRTKHSLVNSKRVLNVRTAESVLQTWVLSNDNVIFTFIEDPITGVRLKSWGVRGGTITENRSRSLWAINTIYKYNVVEGVDTVATNSRTIYPSFDHYVGSTTGTDAESNPTITFNWSGVKHDFKNPEVSVDVAVTATLLNDKNTLDISISMTLQGLYRNSQLVDFQSAIVPSIQMPSIVIQKSDTEADNEDTILTTPVAYGYTYYNPFKYLRIPRFATESFHYDNTKERCYPSGFVGHPVQSLTRFNLGNPGGLPIPAIILGNKSTKQATLFYAMDTEGTNPKGFQFYFDDTSLHLKTIHMSDHQVDPYGIGGYDSPGFNYSRSNSPTWSFRIRPYSCSTTWIDWYGFKLYREEAVPEQEDHGWMPKSFYERYREGEISKPASEIPAILNLYGITTGTADAFPRAADVYIDLYKNSVSPALSDNVHIVAHYQPVNLSYAPNRNTGYSDPLATYNGWEPWAGRGTGETTTGPLVFSSPDFTGINSGHSGAMADLIDRRVLTYGYCVFPFTVAANSSWATTHSGIDVCYKELYQEDQTYLASDYLIWAFSGSTPFLFSTSYTACIGVDLVQEKMSGIAEDLATDGMGIYQDTVGVWGRGCYAKDHVHLDKDGITLKHNTHPRAGFSKYFSDTQKQTLETMLLSAQQAHSGIWGNDKIDSKDLIFRQSSEFPCDLHLKFMPTALSYEPLGPILNSFANSISSPREDALVNSIGTTTVDSLSDATLSGLVSLYGLTHWSCIIDPPNWIQRCPAFQIVYSDRSIFNEWVAIYASNVYDKYFGAGMYSGVGAYGKVVSHPITDDVRAMDWTAFTVQSWPLTNRMSVWHHDEQSAFYNSSLTGITNNENDIFYSGVWSGYTEGIVKKIFRIQGYNPDYIYHGTYEVPLETWSTDIREEPLSTRSSRKSKIYNKRDPYTFAVGTDAVHHTVRKHRSKDNILLVAGSWYSGSTYFSGVFDPAYYGINTSYKVYELDVNTENHGTKTLLSGVPKFQTYTINQDFDKYDYLVLEFEADIPDPDVTDYSYIRYAYDTMPIQSTDTTIAYGYGSQVEHLVDSPLVGFRAPATQQILNNLPQWNKMRQSFDSNGWKLTNSWGMGMEYVIENINKQLTDFSLTTADITHLNELSYTDIDSKEVLNNTTKRNLLYNSSFSIRDVTRNNLPAGWTAYKNNDTYLDNITNIVTPIGLSSDSGSIRVGQQILLNNIPVNNMTASVYLLCDQEVDFTLLVSLETITGISKSYTAKITSRSTEWRRLVLPMTVGAQVYRVNISFIGSSAGKMSISAPQLELNNISKWTSSALDYLPYYPSAVRFNSVYGLSNETGGPKTPVYPISDEKDFTYACIPTRIVKIQCPPKDIELFTSQSFSRKVDQLSQITRTEYSILEDQIVERSTSPTSWDIFGRYNLRDLRLFQDLEYGTSESLAVTITPIASAIRKDMLFVVCKEVVGDTEHRVLKILKPRTPPNGETYLESLTDFDLDINFDILYDLDQISDEEVYNISFSDVDPRFMVITTTNNTKHFYRLYFDYYYFDQSKNRLYTIENYSPGNLIIT